MKRILLTISFLLYSIPAQAQLFNTMQSTPQIAADQQAQRLNMIFQSIVVAYRREFDDFWRNPRYTPAEMAEAHGTRCLKIFQNSLVTRNYINAIDPNVLPADYQEPLAAYTVEVVDGQPTGRITIP